LRLGNRSLHSTLRSGGSPKLSVTDGCLWRTGDGTSVRFRVPESLVNIAHIQRFKWRWLMPSFSGCRDSDQYRATMIIATTMNAAISERARSNDFDRSFVASSGGIRLTQTQRMPCTKGAGSQCRVSFGAMPMVHACNLATWWRAVWSIRDSLPMIPLRT
jgi:hypothetical protein